METLNGVINQKFSAKNFDKSSQKTSSSTYQSTQTSTSTSTNLGDFQQFQPQLYPVKFVWKDKAEVVYLTGDFCNWKQKFIMPKSEESFCITLRLPEGAYQYKFIVDGEWSYSIHHPYINDNGVINNIVEVKNEVKKVNDGYGNKKEGIIMQKVPNKPNDQYKNYFAIGKGDVLHTLVNHIITSKDGSKSKICFIKRVRSKFVSLVYYTPNKN